MLAYVMSQSSIPCSAFLGGISSNFQSNVLVDPKATYSVIEADEFDRSFLRLSPHASIITAMDPDHLDIYGDEASFHEGFNLYAQKHASGGLVVYRFGLPLKTTGLHTKTYGIETPEAYCNGVNLRYENKGFFMDIHCAGYVFKRIELGLPGRHNAENALAVWTLCMELGLSESEIRLGLSTFKGVKRRFEVHIKSEDLVYIDDYAHHPTEIAALVSSIRQQYPTKTITGIFQPHLFSRTRDFLDGFIRELSSLDKVIVMPIYPARELPIQGITSAVLVKGIGAKAQLMTPEEVLDWAKQIHNGVILTIGAGDIDRIVSGLTATFKAKSEE
jgi:UDP-N-acetylmuramate--alanine ligase